MTFVVLGVKNKARRVKLPGLCDVLCFFYALKSCSEYVCWRCDLLSLVTATPTHWTLHHTLMTSCNSYMMCSAAAAGTAS